MYKGKRKSPIAILCIVFSSYVLLAGLPPDVVIISVDTLRADRLSAYGYAKKTSPHIDGLLKKGAVFDTARTIEPLTAPALISMLTSLPPHEHGASRNGLAMYPNQTSVSRILADRGYRNAAFVANWTLRAGLSGLGEHFDHYHEVFTRKRWFGLFLSEATAEDVTDRALSWLEEGREKQPVCLWVHYADPHAPYRFHKDFADQVGLAGVANPSRKQRYDTEIAFTDHHIGRLLQGLSKLKEPRNTLIIFVADHGESLGEHNYWGHGRHLYDVTLRIPMAFIWEGSIPAQRIKAPAQITDVSATILGLLNMPIPDAFQGFDWTRVMAGKSRPPASRVTFYQAHKGAVQTRKGATRGRENGLLAVGMISNGQKEIFRVTNMTRKQFDLSDDPLELKSLVGKKSDISAELKRHALNVDRGLRKANERQQLLNEHDVEMLKSLGYIE